MLHFFQRAANTVANATVGKLRLFADTDGFYKTKNSAGVVTLLGNGIKQIVKTGTVGLVDTYTITLDDNSTRPFTVTNGDDGRSIESIARTAGTGAPGTTDTYTITYSKAPLTSTFQVYNGADGATYTDEMAQDAAALMLTAATHVGISVSYDDANNRLVITNTDRGSTAVTAHVALADPHSQYTTDAEATTIAQGRVTAHEALADPHPQYLTAAEGNAAYAALNHTHTSAQITDFTEAAQDATGAMVSGNTEDGVQVDYDDATNKLNFTNTDKGSSARTAHEAAADPHPQYTTTAEASAAAPVQSVAQGAGISVNTTTGNVVVTNADRGTVAVTAHEQTADPHPQYMTAAEADAQFTTPAEAAAAAPVQSVNGQSGTVTINSASVGLGNVRNPVAPNVHTVATQTLNQTLTAAATMTIPANSLQAGDAFEIDVLFGSLVNTTAASTLEVAIFINGAQNALISAALGTTAVAAPGRGGRALAKVVFRTVGASGTALANGTIHVNNLANFASNQVAAQTINTTANITLDVRVRTSAATSTGTVQFAAIDQAT